MSRFMSAAVGVTLAILFSGSVPVLSMSRSIAAVGGQPTFCTNNDIPVVQNCGGANPNCAQIQTINYNSVTGDNDYLKTAIWNCIQVGCAPRNSYDLVIECWAN
jgi:hypothetical protein